MKECNNCKYCQKSWDSEGAMIGREWPRCFRPELGGNARFFGVCCADVNIKNECPYFETK